MKYLMFIQNLIILDGFSFDDLGNGLLRYSKPLHIGSTINRGRIHRIG